METLTEGPVHVFCPHGTFVEPDKCTECPPPARVPELVVTDVNRETGVITMRTKK